MHGYRGQITAMPDTQGRSDYLDKDSYIGHHARRPTENWVGVSDAVQSATQSTGVNGDGVHALYPDSTGIAA